MKMFQRFLSVVLTLVIIMTVVVPVLEVSAMSVSRDDGIWLFPLSTDRYNSFSDWASCPGTDKCVFCGVYHSGWGDTYHSGQGGHNGIDISAPINTNVYAAAPGTVIYAGYMGARGNTIIIEHAIGNGYSYYSYYQHLSSFVKTSGTVTAGTLIGKVGNSGGNYGYHLHFGIVRGASNLGSSCLNTLEAKGWLIGSGNQGRILNNPSASNWNGSYAGAPKGGSAVLAPLKAHKGSVTYTFNASQVTIGANTPSTTYTLTYNANGGTPTPASQSATAGSSVTVSSVFPERYGYVFKGWSATGTINSTLYQFGQPLTLRANTTLYAMWEEDPLVPENYVVYNGHTYLAFDGTYSQYQAQSLCKGMGGYLATISSESENQAVLNAALPGNRWYYWIGLNDESSEGNYTWLNGESVSYTNWAASEPNGSVSENAAFLNCRTYEGYQLGQWGDLRITGSANYLSDYYHTNVGFVCELDYDITQPIETVTYNGSEYMVFDTSVSWLFAKQLANDFGGYLATITSDSENTVVQNLIMGHSKNIYWLGGSDAAQQGTWSWVNDEPFTYTHWNEGIEPSSKMGEDYLAICAVSTSAWKSPGDWLDAENITINDTSSAYYLGKVGFVVEKSVAQNVPDSSVEATFTIDMVENAKKGDIVTVNMTIAEPDTMIGAIGFVFDYDKTYLKVVPNESTGNYFVVGSASGGAMVVGNEETMKVQFATADGFRKAGTLLSLSFQVIQDIPARQTAKVDADVFVSPVHAQGLDVTYDVTIVPGGVTGSSESTNDTTSKPDDNLHYGNVNQDGRVDAGDALLVLKAAVGKVTLAANQMMLADVSGDGRVDAEDALLILKKAVNRIEQFPVEQ